FLGTLVAARRGASVHYQKLHRCSDARRCARGGLPATAGTYDRRAAGSRDRPEFLRTQPARPEDIITRRAGARYAWVAGAATTARSRVSRRGQRKLPRLLRTVSAVAKAGWIDRRGQRSLVRPCAR